MTDKRIRVNDLENDVLKKVLRIQLGKIQDTLNSDEERVAEAFLERLSMGFRTRWRFKNLME